MKIPSNMGGARMALILLLAAGFADVSVSARPGDITPLIPTPSDAKHGRKTASGINPFPQDDVLSFLEDNRLRDEASRPGYSSALITRLERILPRGVYRFDAECPLIRRPEGQETELVTLSIACLGEKYAGTVTIDLPARDDRIRFLSKATEQRRIAADLELVSIWLSAGRMQWRWVVKNIGYDNPFLEIFRKGYPDLPEAQFLNDGHVSLMIADLLVRASDAAEKGAYRWKENLSVVLRPGMSLRFGRTCPLRVLVPPRQEAADERPRIVLEAVCITSRPLSRINILMAPGGVSTGLGLSSGDIVYADLTFSGIRVNEKEAGLD
ncbi:MAG: hypothetical protein HY042_11535, partial [Spirochaetia bacterium]|nr:hypothetical protein [Spirochaetia bacterium]